jgi:hypothetical protein
MKQFIVVGADGSKHPIRAKSADHALDAIITKELVGFSMSGSLEEIRNTADWGRDHGMQVLETRARRSRHTRSR